MGLVGPVPAVTVRLGVGLRVIVGELPGTGVPVVVRVGVTVAVRVTVRVRVAAPGVRVSPSLRPLRLVGVAVAVPGADWDVLVAVAVSGATVRVAPLR
jgi:hypothetical protein